MISVKLTQVEPGPDVRAQYVQIAEDVINALVRGLQPRDPVEFSVTVAFKGERLVLGSKFKFLPASRRIREVQEGSSRPSSRKGVLRRL